MGHLVRRPPNIALHAHASSTVSTVTVALAKITVVGHFTFWNLVFRRVQRLRVYSQTSRSKLSWDDIGDYLHVLK